MGGCTLALSQPDIDRVADPWLKLGRLLPATLRERIFEPAYFDLLADSCKNGRGHRRLGLHFLRAGRRIFPLRWVQLLFLQ